MSVITGFHSLIYSTDADATRAFLRDVLGWPCVDAGDGWLIFKTPPSELGVHPTEGHDAEPSHSLSMLCDDIHEAIADLTARGVVVSPDVRDRGFGLVTFFDLPGAGRMMLYQPRHPLAHTLDG